MAAAVKVAAIKAAHDSHNNHHAPSKKHEKP
eukprot:CAMPEP_0205937858 /NCGR_PEP_ID=MMETSP1325-20131115/45268_1 /ASSEMBLY_ACC=CAM_ASM_000708 /TAXON_ID=236786 /ORGANISM="Florenciella sp., Strain RCC1007" /LENGTH=30 /DNA_ID= /DNA_START= /DNA_END= /DNA_ORIENTATION=